MFLDVARGVGNRIAEGLRVDDARHLKVLPTLDREDSKKTTSSLALGLHNPTNAVKEYVAYLERWQVETIRASYVVENHYLPRVSVRTTVQ